MQPSSVNLCSLSAVDTIRCWLTKNPRGTQLLDELAAERATRESKTLIARHYEPHPVLVLVQADGSFEVRANASTKVEILYAPPASTVEAELLLEEWVDSKLKGGFKKLSWPNTVRARGRFERRDWLGWAWYKQAWSALCGMKAENGDS